MSQKKYVIYPDSQSQKAVNQYPKKQKQDCGCSKKKKKSY